MSQHQYQHSNCRTQDVCNIRTQRLATARIPGGRWHCVSRQQHTTRFVTAVRGVCALMCYSDTPFHITHATIRTEHRRVRAGLNEPYETRGIAIVDAVHTYRMMRRARRYTTHAKPYMGSTTHVSARKLRTLIAILQTAPNNHHNTPPRTTTPPHTQSELCAAPARRLPDTNHKTHALTTCTPWRARTRQLLQTYTTTPHHLRITTPPRSVSWLDTSQIDTMPVCAPASVCGRARNRAGNSWLQRVTRARRHGIRGNLHAALNVTTTTEQLLHHRARATLATLLAHMNGCRSPLLALPGAPRRR